MSIFVFGTTFVALLIYSAWMTRSWTAEKDRASFFEADGKIKENSVTALRKQLDQDRNIYETRLKAINNAYDDLKKRYLLGVKPDLSDRIFDPSELSEETDPNDSET